MTAQQQQQTPVFSQVTLIEAIYTAVVPNGTPWADRSPEWRTNYEYTINFLVSLATEGSDQRKAAGATEDTRLFATLFLPKTAEDWSAGAEAIRKDTNGSLSTCPLPAEMGVPDYSDGMIKLGIAMKLLEEALPNGQLNRVGFGLLALFDGVSGLQKWVAARATLDNKLKQEVFTHEAALETKEHSSV